MADPVRVPDAAHSAARGLSDQLAEGLLIPASRCRRLAAALTDTVVIPFYLIIQLGGLFIIEGDDLSDHPHALDLLQRKLMELGCLVISSLIPVFYLWRWSATDTSLGKRLFKLRVSFANPHQRLSRRRFLRTLIKTAPFVALSVLAIPIWILLGRPVNALALLLVPAAGAALSTLTYLPLLFNHRPLPDLITDSTVARSMPDTFAFALP